MPRHNNFSNTEMRDIVCIYAQKNYNARAASRRYLELYPDRIQPNHKTFRNVYERLGETGKFRPKRDVTRPKIISVR